MEARRQGVERARARLRQVGEGKMGEKVRQAVGGIAERVKARMQERGKQSPAGASPAAPDRPAVSRPESTSPATSPMGNGMREAADRASSAVRDRVEKVKAAIRPGG